MLNIFQSLIAGVQPDLIVLTEIGVMIIIAAFFAFLARLLKQPLIPAYIIAGILIGPLILGLIKDSQLVISLSQIGVGFLIFTAGIEIKLKKLKEVGKIVFIGGILQIFLLFLAAFFISKGLGFAGKAPVYIGLIVAFSSTMIVVKLLSDKREINSLHGRIIIGILLVQDIAAIIALIFLTSDLSVNSLFFVFLKVIVFAVFAFVLSKISNPLFKNAAKNHELLLIVSISFLFLFIIGSSLFGLSLIIGAFFAGVALANSDYKTEIQGKIAPLREFFSVIFFVTLGMQLKIIPLRFIWLLLVLLILVLILKPLVTMYLVRISGYKKRTSFLTGNALAQTSEFSLIIATLGFSLGYIDGNLFSCLILLTVLTMSLTSYLIKYEKKLFNGFGGVLNIFKRLRSRNEELEYFEKDGKKIIIFGCHRMGSLFLKEFEKEKKEVLAVDYDPEIIRALINKKIPCIYGDFANEEILEKINIKNAEMMISTIPDLEENILLIKKVKRKNSRVIIFIVAERISEAMQLYRAGADYVILPMVIGGQKVSEIIRKLKNSKSESKSLKKEHLQYLKSIHNILY
jgi:Kef-type K+ transport system membrane component KefB